MVTVKTPPPSARPAVKPLAFVVRSPHYESIPTSKWGESFTLMDEVLYVRSLLLAAAAAFYSPVDVYLDSHTLELAKRGNEQMAEFFQSFEGKQQGIPPRSWYLENMLIPLAEHYAIGPSNPILIGNSAVTNMVPPGALSLATFDYERLTHLLAITQIHGADIRYAQAEDEELYRRTLEAHANGDTAHVQELNERRDDTLYNILLRERDNERSSLIWFGRHHEMKRFRKDMTEAKAEFDVAFVDVYKNNGNSKAVQVTGRLITPETSDMGEILDNLGRFLKLGGVETALKLSPIPRDTRYWA